MWACHDCGVCEEKQSRYGVTCHCECIVISRGHIGGGGRSRKNDKQIYQLGEKKNRPEEWKTKILGRGELNLRDLSQRKDESCTLCTKNTEEWRTILYAAELENDRWKLKVKELRTEDLSQENSFSVLTGGESSTSLHNSIGTLVSLSILMNSWHKCARLSFGVCVCRYTVRSRRRCQSGPPSPSCIGTSCGTSSISKSISMSSWSSSGLTWPPSWRPYLFVPLGVSSTTI